MMSGLSISWHDMSKQLLHVSMQHFPVRLVTETNIGGDPTHDTALQDYTHSLATVGTPS